MDEGIADRDWSLSANRPLFAILDETVARHGDRPAISFFGRVWTYRQLGDLVARAAAGLAALGVRRNTRVGLCLPNTPYSVIFYYAVLRAGGIVVNFNPLYVERELTHQLRDSGTEIMIVPDLAAIHGKVERVAADTGLRHIVVCSMARALPRVKGVLFRVAKRRDIAHVRWGGLNVPYAQVVASGTMPPPVPEIDPVHDVAVLQYTGGTTGVPKGAMLTHANLVANTEQVVVHMPSLQPAREKVLAVLPFFHVFAMTSIMNFAVRTGAEMILLPRFELAQVINTIERERPTMFPAVPTIYGAIASACEKTRRNLSSIAACISGGAPLPAEVRARFESLTGCKVVEGYGLTEASPVVSCNPPDALVKDGSIGVPVRGTVVEVRDPACPERLMPQGERGELCVRGPQVMAGYWQRPDETASAFVDGALRTGDIGYVDEDGYLFLVDRIKDVILCGGYNVYPRVIEEALYQHPDVAEAVVIGVPDYYRGQAPKAFVALHAGHTADPASIREFLRGYINKIEMPREIVIRDSLPKTMVGKLSKKELRDEEMRRSDAA